MPAVAAFGIPRSSTIVSTLSAVRLLLLARETARSSKAQVADEAGPVTQPKP